jgi:hypothetical protein
MASQEGGGDRESDVSKKRNASTKLWVPVVILIGALMGVLAYFLSSPYLVFVFPRFFTQDQIIAAEFYLELNIILSTVSISLLVALLIVYARTYKFTRANFVLGLLVVLLALLLQNLSTYPLLYPFIYHTPLVITLAPPVAELFTIIAYTVFLYLSLE